MRPVKTSSEGGEGALMEDTISKQVLMSSSICPSETGMVRTLTWARVVACWGGETISFSLSRHALIHCHGVVDTVDWVPKGTQR